MKGMHKIGAAIAVAITIGNLARPLPAAAPEWPAGETATPAHGGLSVMTFNVKGLPFPIARGRPQALAAIGHRLAELRRAGHQPGVVVLQEAFTNDAKAIARLAGYAHVALGPQHGDVVPASDRDAKGRTWYKGEGVGKWLDSGLVILSDYPIVRTRTMAFPDAMCAGFDCLAAKGVQVAWIAVPGKAAPVAIANTHLNSRKASGVSRARADRMYRQQVSALRAFLNRTVAPRGDLILGGDFNIGGDPGRLAATHASGGYVGTGLEASEAAHCANCAPALRDDLAAIRERDKDKQFFRPAADHGLMLDGITVPFGARNGGNDLSDHLGYIAHYHFTAS